LVSLGGNVTTLSVGGQQPLTQRGLASVIFISGRRPAATGFFHRSRTLKKSRSITLTLMAGLAAACSDGRPREEFTGDLSLADSVRHCVDSEHRVVADSLCTNAPRSGANGTTSGGMMYPYFFYFGGRTMLMNGGTYVSGGTRGTVGSPVRGPVTRGGLGATAATRSRAAGG
jgi:hypothetical protein